MVRGKRKEEKEKKNSETPLARVGCQLRFVEIREKGRGSKN